MTATTAAESSLAAAQRAGRKPVHHRRWLRRLLIAFGILVVLVVVIRLILDPVASHYTRKALDQVDGFAGDFESVHVTVFGPGYTIRRLKLKEDPGGSWKAPVFYAESLHVGVDWRRLFHGELVAAARIVEPKIIVINKGAEKPEKTKKAPDLSEALQKAIPLKVARVEVLRGEFVFRDATAPRHPELWVHDLELAAENLPTRAKLAAARPTTLSGRAVVGKTGALSMFVSADPLASPLAFAGRLDLSGLKVAELYDFIEPKTKLQTPHGTFDVFAEFTVKDGRLNGGVKPVLKNVDVEPAEDGAWNSVKAWLADRAIKLASDRVPERNAIATVVPLEGRVADPDVQLWPAVLGVFRNAFVQGLTSGFAHLPPRKADEKQGVLTQAKEALKKDEGPPKAQPAKAGKSEK